MMDLPDQRACLDQPPDRITTLDFRHSGLDEGSPFLGFNNFAWAQVLQNLKQVCEKA